MRGKSFFSNIFEFRKKVVKEFDAWVEILVIDIVALPLSYALYQVSKREELPYAITALSLFTRIVSAILFGFGFISIGAFVFLCSMILDSIDGKLSRIILGKDPELRGTLDFVFDTMGLLAVIIGIFINFLSNEMHFHMLLLVLYMSLLILFHSCTSSSFRIRAKWGIGVKSLYEVEPRNPLIRMYHNIQNKFKRFNLMGHPTAIESEFLLFVIAPLLDFNLLLIYLALICLAIDTVVIALVPTLLLAKKFTPKGASL